jgi:hypothetical protein
MKAVFVNLSSNQEEASWMYVNLERLQIIETDGENIEFEFPIDLIGRGAGCREQGEKILNSPAKRVSSPSIYGWRTTKMYFETRSVRNTTSSFQAPPFMDGVSPCSLPPAPCLLLTTKKLLKEQNQEART